MTTAFQSASLANGTATWRTEFERALVLKARKTGTFQAQAETLGASWPKRAEIVEAHRSPLYAAMFGPTAGLRAK